MDREKVINEFEHLLNAAKGNYQDFVDLTVDGGEEILALLKEQDDEIYALGVELAAANELAEGYAELLEEKEEEIERLKTPTAGDNHIPLRW